MIPNSKTEISPLRHTEKKKTFYEPSKNPRSSINKFFKDIKIKKKIFLSNKLFYLILIYRYLIVLLLEFLPTIMNWFWISFII